MVWPSWTRGGIRACYPVGCMFALMVLRVGATIAFFILMINCGTLNKVVLGHGDPRVGA